MLFAVKDGAANIQNVRTEEINLIDEDEEPPPVPDTPRRIQMDRQYDNAIPEDQETGQASYSRESPRTRSLLC